MSATAFDVREHQNFVEYYGGTAVTLSAPREKRTVSTPGSLSSHDELALKLLTGTAYGVSESAGRLQLIVSNITPDLDHWRIVAEPEDLNIEKDIAVLLPPKNRRKVVVKARYTGPAKMLISKDDIP